MQTEQPVASGDEAAPAAPVASEAVAATAAAAPEVPTITHILRLLVKVSEEDSTNHAVFYTDADNANEAMQRVLENMGHPATFMLTDGFGGKHAFRGATIKVVECSKVEALGQMKVATKRLEQAVDKAFTDVFGPQPERKNPADLGRALAALAGRG